MALQRPLIIAVRVIHVDPSIIHGKDNILGREMQTGHDTLICRDMSLGAPASLIPSGFNQIFLFEMGSVGMGSASAFSRGAT